MNLPVGMVNWLAFKERYRSENIHAQSWPGRRPLWKHLRSLFQFSLHQAQSSSTSRWLCREPVEIYQKEVREHLREGRV